jgi:glycosyltransferase involved in cell wall biosynthesis
MKITIAASHRFHLLDLAIQLEKLGHDVSFFSYVPNSRCQSFGLSKKASKSLVLVMSPILVLIFLFKKSSKILYLKHLALDFLVPLFSPPTDIYIALGVVYKNSFLKMKKKYNCITIVEWGSKHITEQQAILKEIGAKLNKEYFNERAISAFHLVDYISIPSLHVENSFYKHRFNKDKLFLNHYGVDLKDFYPTILSEQESFDLIFVGAWSLRKGCDVLVEVCRKFNFKLLHVGYIIDVEFPNEENFIHVGKVDQRQLVDFYKKAKCFILPSREEGMAMVQLQALACGLPVICTEDTGGNDLKKYLESEEFIINIGKLDADNLSIGIKKGLQLAEIQNVSKEERCIIKKNIGNSELSWEGYGKRYETFLKKIIIN